jgi:hypothetical protein
MKDFIITEYVFSPGISGSGYVDLIGVDDFDISRVISIINQTKGVVIYATGSASTRYTSVSGNKIYLFYNTSSHSASDKLQIIYNTSNSLKTSDTDTQEMVKLLSRLVKIVENQQSTDSAQRQRITLDSITGSLTLSTITTVGTISTITGGTITTVSNASAIAGMGQEQYLNIARNTYANSIRNKLFIT